MNTIRTKSYEMMNPAYVTDADGDTLDGSKHCYTLKLERKNMPAIDIFWSLAMYGMPGKLLVTNPIKRYLINSLMIPTLEKDEDGGFTIYLQKDSPGMSKESNWLPAPSGPFAVVMRIYFAEALPVGENWIESFIRKLSW